MFSSANKTFLPGGTPPKLKRPPSKSDWHEFWDNVVAGAGWMLAATLVEKVLEELYHRWKEKQAPKEPVKKKSPKKRR